MSETLNKTVAFLDAAVAELDKPPRRVPDYSVVEWRREKAALEIPTTGHRAPKAIGMSFVEPPEMKPRHSGLSPV